MTPSPVDSIRQVQQICAANSYLAHSNSYWIQFVFFFLPQLWFRRSRLSSVRTLPERSEFRGSVRDAEVREEGLQTRSLHRSRLGSDKSHPCVASSRPRKLSTASSPSSYKVWTAEEEEELDHYGYVLPGSPGTPERGKMHSKHSSILFDLLFIILFTFVILLHSLQNISIWQKKHKPEE